MRKLVKLVLKGIAGFAILLVVLALAGLCYRAWRQHEVAAALAIRTPNGIDEARFVRIGGIDQWITIRGDDRSNPVLLFLHGGPGSAFVPGVFSREWEKHFTMVVWDQRGAGRTYIANAKPAQGLTIDRMAGDGIELAELVRQHLHKPKVVLMGGSWGTVLGLTMIKARPDLFSVYVGAGNVVDPVRGDAYARDVLIGQAKAKGDAKSLKTLEDLGPPPWPPNKIGAERWILETYAPKQERNLVFLFFGTVLSAPNLSLGDIVEYFKAQMASQSALLPQIYAWKAERLGRDFQVPMVFVQGTDDIQTPTPIVRAYADWITAPSKTFILVPGGGHTASITSQDFVLKRLVSVVKPLAVAADASLAQSGEWDRIAARDVAPRTKSSVALVSRP
jgi:pimeloyl-ACP methyl ester carboxylesterase